jgi:hypothetical protein
LERTRVRIIMVEVMLSTLRNLEPEAAPDVVCPPRSED